MPARPGRPKLHPDERRVRLGLLVSREARDALRRLSRASGEPQNRVVERLIMENAGDAFPDDRTIQRVASMYPTQASVSRRVGPQKP